MPSPSQIRDIRVRQLVYVARDLIESSGSTDLLVDKLRPIARKAWPTVRQETRRAYVTAALMTVLSQPHTESDLLTGTVSPQEGQ